MLFRSRVPVVEWLKPWEQTKEIIAMPAGGTLNRSELYVLHINSRRMTQVDLGNTEDQYLRILAWLPDGTELIAVARYATAIHVWDLRAIRSQLKTMGLDWDWPEFGPAIKGQPSNLARAGSIKLEIITR